MFWFKRKEIVVDCFTPHHKIYEAYRPIHASHFLPDGWKKLPKTVSIENNGIGIDRGTMKKCIGFTNLFSSGFILQLWTDVILDTTSNEMQKIAAGNFIYFSHHPEFQSWAELYSGYKHVKFSSPWQLTEKTGVKFTWNRCDWHNTDSADKMHIVSAVTDFKYQTGTQINMFIKNNSRVNLSAGQPMVHLIPMSEHKIKLKYHLVSQQEYDSRFYYNSKFTSQYAENKRIINSKCPFGFGK
jgi:hypothetical protein